VDLGDYVLDDKDVVLQLELIVPGAGGGRDTDGYPIFKESQIEAEESPYGYDSIEVQPDEEPEPSPTPEREARRETATGTFDRIKDFAGDNLLWIIIGGAALIIAIAVIIISVSRRKKHAAAVPPPPIVHTAPPSPPIPEHQPAPMTVAPQPEPEHQPAPVTVAPPSPPPGKPRISLRLTKVGLSEEQVFKAEFAGELIVGRSPGKSMLPFSNDERLSGRHCSISYEPAGIVLRDLGSTNGTFVNGVPIEEEFVLENDDVMLIGSMELRVNWIEL
jgi:hypothetical protein